MQNPSPNIFYLFLYYLLFIYLCSYLASPVYKQKQTRTEPTNSFVNVCTCQCVWVFFNVLYEKNNTYFFFF